MILLDTNIFIEILKEMDIPDSLIASTALLNDAVLFTYNKKDFRYSEGLQVL